MSNIIKMIEHLHSPKELLLAYEAIKQRLQDLGFGVWGIHQAIPIRLASMQSI